MNGFCNKCKEIAFALDRIGCGWMDVDGWMRMDGCGWMDVGVLTLLCSYALMLSCSHALMLSCSYALMLLCSYALMGGWGRWMWMDGRGWMRCGWVQREANFPPAGTASPGGWGGVGL